MGENLPDSVPTNKGSQNRQAWFRARKAVGMKDLHNHFGKLHCDELLILWADYFTKSDSIPKDFANQAPQFKPFIPLLAISPTSAQKLDGKSATLKSPRLLRILRSHPRFIPTRCPD
jgi:hypothetical protein